MKGNSRDDRKHAHDSTTTISIVTVLVIVVLCLLTPLLVNLAFQHTAPASFLEARWAPGELLGYAGGVFSCLETIFLGCFTLHQNRQLRDETNRRIEIEEQRNRLAFRPTFNITSCANMGDRITLEIKNVSASFARDMAMSGIVGIDNKELAKWETEKTVIPFLDRGGAQHFCVGEWEASKLLTSNELARIEMYLSCTNQFGDEYLYELTGFRIDENNGGLHQFYWNFEEVSAAEIEKKQAAQTPSAGFFL